MERGRLARFVAFPRSEATEILKHDAGGTPALHSMRATPALHYLKRIA
jgi:hypothetical protein